MKLRQFIKKFDFKKPDWSQLPDGFPDCDLARLSSGEIGKFAAIRSLWELSQPKEPKARSRVWQSTNGYIYLVVWSNASLLRILATKWFRWFKGRNLEDFRGDYPVAEQARYGASGKLKDFRGSYKMGSKFLDRLEGQLLDSLRSTVANVEENFARPTTREYLDFLGYSQGEFKGS